MHSFINLTKSLYILWMELFWNWRNKNRSILSKLEVLTSLKIGRVCLLIVTFFLFQNFLALSTQMSYLPPKTRFLHIKCTKFSKLFFVAWLLKNPLVPAVSQLEVQFKNSLEKVSITSSNRSWLIHIKNDSNMATEIDWY